MNQKGLTRGDGLAFLCVALIFGFSFAPYYKAVQSSSRGTNFASGSSSDSDSGSGNSETYNAWAQTHWPLMAVVILLPLLAFAALVLHRYMQNADHRPVGGLTLRQWATAMSVVAAWSALWSLGGNAFGVADEALKSVSVDSEHGFGAFVILPFTLLMAILLLVMDRVPALSYPLFVAAPQYPPGYVPMQPNYGTGMYPQPVPAGMPPAGTQSVPPGTPIAHMPPPVTPAAGVPAASPASAPAAASAPPAAASSAPAGEFEQFWLAVPEARPLLPVGGLDKTPVATLVPGTWYLAVEAAGDGLVVEADGTRGVLWNTAGIQRGE